MTDPATKDSNISAPTVPLPPDLAWGSGPDADRLIAAGTMGPHLTGPQGQQGIQGIQGIQGPAGETVPIGTIIAFAGNSVPSGYLECTGAVISRTTYSNLYTAIGTAWGAGDGSTTFKIPDARAAHLRGVGTSTQFTENTISITLAQIINDAMHGHRHRPSTNTPNQSMNFAPAVGTFTNAFGGSASVDNGYDVGDPKTDGTRGTPRTDVETRPKAIGVRMCIKY